MTGDDSGERGLDGRVLDRLYAVIEGRRGADPATSHTAALFKGGNAKIVEKFGEEAVELVVAGVAGDKAALAGESADLLYHLLVLWAARQLKPAEVWAALERRKGISGIAEKAGRGEDESGSIF
ncbi:MAG: phosphoribosyl-ATP diphosphatase [Kiloniellaceae bacterium]